MGGIVVVVKNSPGVHGSRYWGGHAHDVTDFFKKKGLSAFSPNAGEVVDGIPTKMDSHNGTVTIDVEKRTITFDTDYFKLDLETIRFWNLLGFTLLGRLRGAQVD